MAADPLCFTVASQQHRVETDSKKRSARGYPTDTEWIGGMISASIVKIETGAYKPLGLEFKRRSA